MLSSEEISHITLPAKLIYEHGNAPYFKREVNEPLIDENGNALHFFIRYRVSPRDPNLFRWSRVEKMVDLKDVAPKHCSSSQSCGGSIFTSPPGSPSEVHSSTNSIRPLSIASPRSPPSAMSPNTMMSSGGACRESLLWGKKRFFVAFQVVGEARPVAVHRLSNKPPTMEEVHTFCAGESMRHTNYGRSSSESLTSLGGGGPNEESGDSALPAEAYLPTPRQVKLLFERRAKLWEKQRHWSREDVEEHRQRMAPYAAIAGAAAPVQRTALDGLNRQFLAQVQQVQKMSEQRHERSNISDEGGQPSLSSHSFFSLPTDGIPSGATGEGGSTTIATEVDEQGETKVTERESEFHEHDEVHGVGGNTMSGVEYSLPLAPLAGVEETGKASLPFASPTAGIGALTPHSPLSHSPFLPKNRKRSRLSLEPTLQGSFPSSFPSSSTTSYSQNSQDVAWLDSSDANEISTPSPLFSSASAPSSQVEGEKGRCSIIKEVDFHNNHNNKKREALHVLSSLSHLGGAGNVHSLLSASPPLSSLPVISSSSSSSMGGQTHSILSSPGKNMEGSGPSRGFSPISCVSSPIGPRRTTTILQGSGMALIEAAGAAVAMEDDLVERRFIQSPFSEEVTTERGGAHLYSSEAVSTFLHEGGMRSDPSTTSSGMGGSCSSFVPLPRQLRCPSSPATLPHPPANFSSVGGSDGGVVGSPIEAFLTPERIKMWEAAAVNQAHFHSYVSNPEREGFHRKVSALTQRNQRDNKKRALLGVENQQRLKRAGNLQESSGLWVTDDTERALKAANYTSRTAGDAGGGAGGAATNASSPSKGEKNSSNSNKHMNNNMGEGGEMRDTSKPGKIMGKGDSVSTNSNKTRVEWEDPKVREFKEHREARLVSFEKVPSSLFDQLLASVENTSVSSTSPALDTSSGIEGGGSAEKGREVVVAGLGRREHPFRLLTSPSSLFSSPLSPSGGRSAGRVGAPPPLSETSVDLHRKSSVDGKDDVIGEGRREESHEASAYAVAEAAGAVSSPLFPLSVRSQLVHRCAVVTAAASQLSEKRR